MLCLSTEDFVLDVSFFYFATGTGKQRKVASCSKLGPCGVQGDDLSTCGWSYTFGNWRGFLEEEYMFWFCLNDALLCKKQDASHMEGVLFGEDPGTILSGNSS